MEGQSSHRCVHPRHATPPPRPAKTRTVSARARRGMKPAQPRTPFPRRPVVRLRPGARARLTPRRFLGAPFFAPRDRRAPRRRRLIPMLPLPSPGRSHSSPRPTPRVEPPTARFYRHAAPGGSEPAPGTIRNIPNPGPNVSPRRRTDAADPRGSRVPSSPKTNSWRSSNARSARTGRSLLNRGSTRPGPISTSATASRSTSCGPSSSSATASSS